MSDLRRFWHPKRASGNKLPLSESVAPDYWAKSLWRPVTYFLTTTKSLFLGSSQLKNPVFWGLYTPLVVACKRIRRKRGPSVSSFAHLRLEFTAVRRFENRHRFAPCVLRSHQGARLGVFPADTSHGPCFQPPYEGDRTWLSMKSKSIKSNISPSRTPRSPDPPPT